MLPLSLQTITVLTNTFRRLERQVPPPQQLPFRNGFVFRFVEQTLEQALLLKLARFVTGLRAVDVLLRAGLLQEMAATCRMLDEIGEDIAFLAAPLTNDEITELHERYLRGFWAEEFQDTDNTLARHQKPDTPRRSKIQAYVQRILNPIGNSSLMSDVSQAISSTYSGYIHASAVQVLDLYGGDPPHFHIEGMQGTPRMDDHVYDAWNYFYRGIVSGIIVARAFGDQALSRTLGSTMTNSLSSPVVDLMECNRLQVLSHRSESLLPSLARPRFGADAQRGLMKIRTCRKRLFAEKGMAAYAACAVARVVKWMPTS